MRKKALSITLSLFFLLIITIFIGCSTDEHVHIKDPQLLNAIHEKLDLDDEEELTKTTLQDLKELDASHRNIVSLDGIEAASKLTTLHLQGNNIENLQPLLALDHLKAINLRGNPFSHDENSEAMSIIFQLLDKGVIVDYIHDPPLGIFYKITGAHATVYLFGSIHIGSELFYPLHREVEAAFQEANHLAVEIDLTKEIELEMLEMMLGIGLYHDGETLQEVLNNKKAFRKLERILTPKGYNKQLLNKFKPFLVEEILTTEAGEELGFFYDHGVDNYFLNRAEGQKNIISLETVEDQLSLYDILSEETQIESLLATIENYDTIKAEISELLDSWSVGDVEMLAEMRSTIEFEREDYIQYVKALTVDRDKRMAEKIEQFLQSNKEETYFIVVGALHLVGENSIIDILTNKGYHIENGYDKAS